MSKTPMKLYVSAEKVAVSHLTLAVSRVLANRESPKHFGDKSGKSFDFTGLC